MNAMPPLLSTFQRPASGTLRVVMYDTPPEKREQIITTEFRVVESYRLLTVGLSVSPSCELGKLGLEVHTDWLEVSKVLCCGE